MSITVAITEALGYKDRETAQQLRMLATLKEDKSLGPSTQMR